MFIVSVYRNDVDYGNVGVFSDAKKAEDYVSAIASRNNMEPLCRKEIYSTHLMVHKNITLTFLHKMDVVEYEINHIRLDPEEQDKRSE